MSRNTDILGLDEKAVGDLADAYYGYATYLVGLEAREYDMHIASCYLIAAVYRSLLEPRGGQEAFRLAARFYIGVDEAYAKIVAVCAMGPEIVLDSKVATGENEGPGSVFGETILRQFVAAQKGEVSLEEWDAFSAFPTGRLGIPLRTYIAAFRNLAEVNGEFNEESRNWLAPISYLLLRAAEVPEFLQADTYHWNTLSGTFIPYEPEILAACLCFCTYAKAKNWKSFYLLELSAPGLAGMPLLIATEMVYGRLGG